jgi:protease-4
LTGDMNVSMQNPVSANVEGNLMAVDQGPLEEVPVPPCLCGPRDSKIAVIDVDGILVNLNPSGPYSIGENPVAAFQEKLQAAAADPAVKAVVLRINSPGGGVAATELMAQELRQFRQCSSKPVVACLLDLGTGGGYYLASGCERIVAIPAAIVGGIGVVFNSYYAEVAMEQMNVFNAGIKAGDRIDMGTPARKMTDPEKQMLTAMAQEYHAAFKQAVLQGRPAVKPDADFFDGRVMTAAQAVSAGLVDRVGTLSDALAVACQLSKAGNARSVMYCRKSFPARSVYATTSNRPMQATMWPWSVPGLDRSHLPLFLYLWQAEPTLLKLSGM